MYAKMAKAVTTTSFTMSERKTLRLGFLCVLRLMIGLRSFIRED